MQVQAATSASASRPAVARPGREVPACLAAIHAEVSLSREQRARACLTGISERAHLLEDLSGQKARDEERTQERQWREHVVRWEAAAYAVYLEDEDLLGAEGHRSAEEVLAACWPGPARSRTHLGSYLGLVRHLPEPMAMTRGYSLNFFILLSEVQEPEAIRWLWAQAQTGRRLGFVRRGAEAASAARRGGGPPEEIRRAAEAGVESAELLARIGRDGRAESQAAAAQAQLCSAIGGALPYLGPEAQEAAHELLRRIGTLGPAPAERRARPRRGPAAERVKPVSRGPGPALSEEDEPGLDLGPGDEALDELESEDDGAGPAKDGADDQDSPGEEPEGPGAPEADARLPAKKPVRRALYQELFPVAYPVYEADFSLAEQNACAALTAFHHGKRHADRLLHLFRKEQVPIRNELQLHYCQVASAYGDVRRAVEAAIAGWAESGRLVQEQVLKENPGVPAEDLWPLEVRPDRIGPPMTWLCANVLDPLHDADPSEAERELFWVLGLVEAATLHLDQFLARLAAHDEISETLMHQLERQMYAARGFIGGLSVNFYYGMLAAQEDAQARRPELEAARERALQADAQVIVLGDDWVSPNLVKVATAEDGSHVAITLDKGWVIVALGATGVGKSQLGVQLCEGLLLLLPGLNRLTRAGVAVIFAADWRKGRTRHQHLRGFYPNPDMRQWQGLRERFAITFGPTNAAYCRGILCCLPGTAQHYQELYPDLIERGLEVRELRLHPGEWSNFSYNLMLGCGDKVAGRSQYQNFVSSMRALLGDRATPARMQAEFRKSGLGGPSKRAMDAHFELMKRLTSQNEHVDHLIREDGVPVFVYLESQDLGAEQVLALQLAVMNALNRPLAANDPYVLYILEEVAKQGISDALWRAYEEMTKEVRHGMRSLYLAAHLPTDVPAGVLSMASGVLQFGGTSPEAHRKLRELSGLFYNVSAADVIDLPDRMAYGAFRRTSDERYGRAAQLYSLRASCIEAGGETITRGMGR